MMNARSSKLAPSLRPYSKSVSNLSASRTLLVVVMFVAIFASDRFVQSQDHVVVVLDDSSSMRHRLRNNRNVIKMDAAKKALIRVLEDLPDTTKIGVVTLHDGEEWTVPLGSIDSASMESSIRAIKPHRGTPLGKYLKIASDTLLRARDQNRYGTYRLLVVTDGEANDRHKVEEYLPDILSRGIAIDVIGVDMRSKHGLATKTHSYRRANDEKSLSQAISEVMAESIGSSRTNEEDYQLLEGLPNEIGLAMVKALAGNRNHPIGEPEPTPTEPADTFALAKDAHGVRVPDASTNRHQAEPDEHKIVSKPIPSTGGYSKWTVSLLAGPVILCFLVVAFIVFLIKAAR